MWCGPVSNCPAEKLPENCGFCSCLWVPIVGCMSASHVYPQPCGLDTEDEELWTICRDLQVMLLQYRGKVKWVPWLLRIDPKSQHLLWVHVLL